MYDFKLVLEDCEWTKKELELIFSPNQVYSIWKSTFTTCLLSYSVTSFFTDIHCIPAGFRAISMSFLSFLSQKTFTGEFLRPWVILSKSYLRKRSNWPGPSSSIIFSFFENAIKSERVGVRDQYFHDFHIYMIFTIAKNLEKVHEVTVTCPGWFNMELPNEELFPLTNRCCDHCKNIFYQFS